MTTTKKKIAPDSLCYQITQKVKDVRLKMGCSQVNFAEKAGVAKSLVAKYELGIHSIEPETLERMAKNYLMILKFSFLSHQKDFILIAKIGRHLI